MLPTHGLNVPRLVRTPQHLLHCVKTLVECSHCASHALLLLLPLLHELLLCLPFIVLIKRLDCDTAQQLAWEDAQQRPSKVQTVKDCTVVVRALQARDTKQHRKQPTVVYEQARSNSEGDGGVCNFTVRLMAGRHQYRQPRRQHHHNPMRIWLPCGLLS